VGFLFTRTHPPIYEAIATFSVNIDLEKVPQKPLELYDEDLALATTQSVLFSPGVIKAVLASAAQMGFPMDTTRLIADSSIERQHAFWLLRFRSTDPTFAQALVNFWAEGGYKAMLEWQAAGTAPPYVVFSPPTLSGKPISPVYYGTNKSVLWGSLTGWLVCLVIIEIIVNRPKPINKP